MPDSSIYYGKTLDLIIEMNRAMYPKGLDLPHSFNPSDAPGPKTKRICLTCGQMAWYRLHKES